MWGAIIGAGISVASNALGSWIANKRKKEAQEKYNEVLEGVKGDLDAEINGNYLDRADARNAIRRATDANTEALRQLNTQAIRSSATDEAKVAMASKLNKSTADLVGYLAGVGEQHKDRLKMARRSLLLNKALYDYQNESDVSGMENVLSSIGSAAQSLGTAWSNNTSPKSETATDGAVQAVRATDGAVQAVRAGEKSGAINATNNPLLQQIADPGQYAIDKALGENNQVPYGTL